VEVMHEIPAWSPLYSKTTRDPSAQYHLIDEVQVRYGLDYRHLKQVCIWSIRKPTE
jgi:hypothetical protein